MILLKLTDGMGNQMFQYAYARYLQSIYGGKIYFDLTKLGGQHVRSYGLNHFRLNSNVVIPSRFLQYASRFYTKIVRLFFNRLLGVSLHSEKGFHSYIKYLGYYTTDEPIRYFAFTRTFLPVKLVRGFFQSPKFFSSITTQIKQDFEIKENFNSTVESVRREIEACNSVCLHIRRGDFTLYDKFQVCDETYYQKGIDQIKNKVENPVFFVFSNSPKDLEWIKQNYRFNGNIRYVNVAKSAIEDFYLMRHCKHFVISNSTFSWWAAYLGENDDKMVIAPYPWIKEENYVDDIYDDGWIVLKNN